MTGLSHTTNHDQPLGFILNDRIAAPKWQDLQEGTKTPSFILSEAEQIPPCHRLVVILPDAVYDIFDLAKKIWNLAAADGLQVLLLARPCRDEREYHVRVTLTTLAALIRDNRVTVSTQLVMGLSIAKAVCQAAQPEDVLVCFEEQFVPGIIQKRRLADLLAQQNHIPVYTLHGPVEEPAISFSVRFKDFVLLAVCLASMVAFFAFQVWISQNMVGAFRVMMQILAVLGEVWVINLCSNQPFNL